MSGPDSFTGKFYHRRNKNLNKSKILDENLMTEGTNSAREEKKGKKGFFYSSTCT